MKKSVKIVYLFISVLFLLFAFGCSGKSKGSSKGGETDGISAAEKAFDNAIDAAIEELTTKNPYNVFVKVTADISVSMTVPIININFTSQQKTKKLNAIADVSYSSRLTPEGQFVVQSVPDLAGYLAYLPPDTEQRGYATLDGEKLYVFSYDESDGNYVKTEQVMTDAQGNPRKAVRSDLTGGEDEKAILSEFKGKFGDFTLKSGEYKAEGEAAKAICESIIGNIFSGQGFDGLSGMPGQGGGMTDYLLSLKISGGKLVKYQIEYSQTVQYVTVYSTIACSYTFGGVADITLPRI